MTKTIQSKIWGRIDVKLKRIASYGRPPVWTAELAGWPSMPAVAFTAFDDGTLRSETVRRAAIDAIRTWQQQNAVD